MLAYNDASLVVGTGSSGRVVGVYAVLPFVSVAASHAKGHLVRSQSRHHRDDHRWVCWCFCHRSRSLGPATLCHWLHHLPPFCHQRRSPNFVIVVFVGDHNDSPLQEAVDDVLGKGKPDFAEVVLERRGQFHVLPLLSQRDSTREKLSGQHRTRSLDNGVGLEHVLKSVDLL